MPTATHQPFTYESMQVPAAYICSRCHVPGLKLWRQYNTMTNHLKLVCARCADPKTAVDRSGCHKDRYGQKSDQLTDIIGTTGSLVPAVPTVEGDSYWGYTSVPLAGCVWWKALPTYFDEAPLPFHITPEEAEREKRHEEMKRASAQESLRLREEWRQSAIFCVEATDAEHQFLWERHHCMVQWEQLNPGEIATIGHFKKKPVCVEIRWARLDGQIVMFYYPCSSVVEWSWVRNWLADEYKGRSSCNAMNFHHCLDEIRRKAAGAAGQSCR